MNARTKSIFYCLGILVTLAPACTSTEGERLAKELDSGLGDVSFIDDPQSDQSINNLTTDEGFDVQTDSTLDVESDDALDVLADDVLDVLADDTLDAQDDSVLDTQTEDTLDVRMDDTLDVESDDVLDAQTDDVLDVLADDTLDAQDDSALDMALNDVLDAQVEDTSDVEASDISDAQSDVFDADTDDVLDVASDSALDADTDDVLDEDVALDVDGQMDSAQDSSEPDSDSGTNTAPHNILIVVADDLGLNEVAVYNTGSEDAQPPTPNIDGFAQRGVRFDLAYADPVCSPTRAALYTGRHGFRNGVGNIIRAGDTFALSLNETTLPDLLKPAGYFTALVGKWHLGMQYGPEHDPIEHGWDYFEGTKGNVGNFYSYGWRVGSSEAPNMQNTETVYATTKVTNEALRLVGEMSQPWSLTVTYHAPHRPFHVPPTELHSYGTPTDTRLQYEAMIEALDTEFGRLLEGVDLETTTVFFVSDNGGVGELHEFGANEVTRAKGTLYEAGVDVPFIVAGRGVDRAPAVSTTPVHIIDIFATALSIAGVALPDEVENSYNLMPILQGQDVNRVIYAERFANADQTQITTNRRMARDRKYKIIVNSDTDTWEFHDLLGARQERTGGTTTILCDGALSSAISYSTCRATVSDEEWDAFLQLREVINAAR